MQNKTVKKVQLGKQLVQEKQESDNQFDQFMQQKLQNNSDLRRQYQQEPNPTVPRVQTSKPFQISKQKTTDDDIKSQTSAQTEFTFSSQNSNRPYAQFYKTFKSVNTSVPSRQKFKKLDQSSDRIQKQVILNESQKQSFVSTEKTDEVTDQNDFDALSITQMSQKSQNVSYSSKQQSFKQFVKIKKQQISNITDDQVKQVQKTKESDDSSQLKFKGWVFNDQTPTPSRPTTTQYSQIMENMEQIIQNTSQTREQYINELDKYVQNIEKKRKRQITQIQPKKEQQNVSEASNKQIESSLLSEQEKKKLEKEIRKLEKKLELKEQERFEKITQLTMESLHTIAAEPLENLSNLSSDAIRNRSLFITEMLRNRSRLQKQLQNQETELENIQEEDIQSRFEMMNSRINEIEDEQIIKQQILPEMEKRLQLLMNNLEEPASKIFEPNPYYLFTNEEIRLKWDQIHRSLKNHNKNHHEFESLETYNDILPKDKTLREEALSRFIKTKSTQVNKELMENAQKQQSGTLEDKYKIQDLVKSIRIYNKNTVQSVFINEEEKQELQKKFDEIQSLEVDARKSLSQINIQDLTKDLRSLKHNLDRAIEMSSKIQQEIKSDPRYIFAEELSSKKEILQNLQDEATELDQKAEAIFRLEEFVNTLLQDAMKEETQNNKIEQYESHDEVETINYDKIFTDRVKEMQPYLFENNDDE